MRVAERRPDAIEDVRTITERYWEMEELQGEQIVRLFEDWDGFRSRMLRFMRDYDVLLCPVDYRPAPPHPAQASARDPDSGISAFHGATDPLRFNYTLPFSLCGYPCVVVRAGTSPDDLPIGVQVVARPWKEERALAVARLIEQALGGWQAPDRESSSS
jgi:amidase